jgi:hypothetical protein
VFTSGFVSVLAVYFSAARFANSELTGEGMSVLVFMMTCIWTGWKNSYQILNSAISVSYQQDAANFLKILNFKEEGGVRVTK